MPLCSEVRAFGCVLAVSVCELRPAAAAEGSVACIRPAYVRGRGTYHWLAHAGESGTEQVGEKLLRAGLVRTPEWQARDASLLAGALAAIVTVQDASRLRKSHFLELCWHWHYASPYWAPSGRAAGGSSGSKRKVLLRRDLRKPAAAAVAASQALISVQPARTPASLLEAFRAMLAIDVAAFGAADRGFRFFDAAAAEPRAPLTLIIPDLMMRLNALGAARYQSARQGAVELCSASTAAEAADEPRNGTETDMAEKQLLNLSFTLMANSSATSALTPEARVRLSPPDAAVIEDVALALQPLSTFICRAQTQLASLRASNLRRSELLAAAAMACSAAADCDAIITRRGEARLATVLPRFAALEMERSGGVSPYALALTEEYVRLGSYTVPRLASDLGVALQRVR